MDVRVRCCARERVSDGSALDAARDVVGDVRKRGSTFTEGDCCSWFAKRSGSDYTSA